MYKELNTFNNVIEYLSTDIRLLLSKLPKTFKENIEEIRLRNHKPLNLYIQGKNYFISKENTLTEDPKKAFIVNQQQINNTFQLITNHSVYAFSEEITNGFITICGGHRVGLGGKIVYGPKGIENIRNLSSLNIRIAREKKGISNHIISYLLNNEGEFHNTLIISPPQCGKTTLIRDIIRNLSDGYKTICRGFKISLIDERSEIGGVYNGIPQKDIGLRTDVLDGCLKSDGIMMAIRSLSPDIIAVDEIGGTRDVEAIDEALRAGIKFIATIHGHGLKDIYGKTNMRKLMREKIFKRYIILDRTRGVGTISAIIDGESLVTIYPKKGDKDEVY
ncbi:stage III sporulation protein AA [Wansuia hejianensis]|uniref:Stage III sporulation protein AA n=1 Tax=Wansuia hejianensis TaxID=2763667 RepID=A0A926IML8_9FIRM|nr:stage III sporulation protein AA [Wansuia hejianensis]MBC8590580.1 stage III sporulation protein AA [Wansuia hejianensis]